MAPMETQERLNVLLVKVPVKHVLVEQALIISAAILAFKNSYKVLNVSRKFVMILLLVTLIQLLAMHAMNNALSVILS